MKYIFFLLLAFNLSAQEHQKSEYLYDEDGRMFAKEFLIGEGMMSPEERLEIATELNKISRTVIDTSSTIIINFFYKGKTEPNGSCIDHYTNDSKYLRALERKKSIVQFFVTQQNYKYTKENSFEDANDLIRSKLFRYKFSCGNYVIIKPNGKFFRKLGEYQPDEIIENLKRI